MAIISITARQECLAYQEKREVGGLTASGYSGVKSRGDLTYGKVVSGMIVPETQISS